MARIGLVIGINLGLNTLLMTTKDYCVLQLHLSIIFNRGTQKL